LGSGGIISDSIATRQQVDWLSTTSTAPIGPTLRRWRQLSGSGWGRWLFARAVCRKAPYFSTISPRFIELRPTLCRAGISRRRRVENHVGSIHALAMGNLAELVAGLVTEVTIPPTMRWLPRGMTIEYLKRAQTGVTATARLDRNDWGSAENVGVPVTIVDSAGQEVVRAVITMYVSPRSTA